MEYAYEGKAYPLESDDSRGNGIHGYVHCRPWRVVEQSEQHVVGRFQATVDDPSLQTRWPADFAIECEYRLAGNALECRMQIENPGERTLPCGLGSHPYFRLPLGGGSANDCTVAIPADNEWLLEAMLPTGDKAPTNAALKTGERFESLKLDNVFTDLKFNDGWFKANITDQANKRQLEVRFDDLFSECVVYTPPHREAICIEPYSCVPGLGGNAEYDHGWRELAAGESATGRMVIELRSI